MALEPECIHNFEEKAKFNEFWEFFIQDPAGSRFAVKKSSAILKTLRYESSFFWTSLSFSIAVQCIDMDLNLVGS